jgi:uncharacterized membrane protein
MSHTRIETVNHEASRPRIFVPAVRSLTLGLATLSDRFRLVALASVLYIVGGFLLTAFVNVPMNEELARVASASPGELAGARAAYEGPWNFWNGVRTVFSSMAFLTLIGA